MKLSSLISQINQNITVDSSSYLEQGLKNGMQAILGKLPGQAITGEVLLKDGADVLISLGKNQLLQAKLEGNMSAQIGQLLTFQIKNNSAAKVVLTPLFENLSQDPNVSKALQAAGLPENNTTAQMVKAMMQEGLPIDRQSLYQMNRVVTANPQANIQTLVQMQRLSLPITPEQIVQFEAYKNYQHQMSAGIADIVDAFSQSFQEIVGTETLQEGIGFYKNVLGILTDEASFPSPEGTEQAFSGRTGNEIDAVLSGQSREALLSQLKLAGAPENLMHAVANNTISGRELCSEIYQLLSADAPAEQEALFRLLEGREFKEILKNEMTGQWLMQPEEVASDQSVERFYERLNQQMNRLGETLIQSGKADTPLAKAVANVTGNIDFMNQLNQMFTYVQLPLKLQDQYASGELFVYTNKKSLARKEGSVSALLHLDMEHLGSLDVYVALNGQKVSTKFYLKDESALDLIAQKIHLLNERLERRGYHMDAEFISREEKTNVMEEILKQDKNISVLAGYSFDARA